MLIPFFILKLSFHINKIVYLLDIILFSNEMFIGGAFAKLYVLRSTMFASCVLVFWDTTQKHFKLFNSKVVHSLLQIECIRQCILFCYLYQTLDRVQFTTEPELIPTFSFEIMAIFRGLRLAQTRNLIRDVLERISSLNLINHSFSISSNKHVYCIQYTF